MSEFNYSIIIPHKNIPMLLERCLASIPKRDDLEVIIVDDNSDPSIVDFDNFPGKDCLNTKVIFDKSGKGAGKARNIGIQHAKGKWLIFADADDYFVKDFNFIIDRYINSEEDIVYFKHRNVLSANPDISGTRCHEYVDVLESSIPLSEKELFFRTRHNVPWSKMIKRKFVQEKQIRYEEIKFSNDIYFNIMAGCVAAKVLLVNEYFYVLTNRNDSLTGDNCRTDEELYVRSKAHIDMQMLLERYGYYQVSPALWWLPRVFYRNKWLFVKLIKYSRDSHLSIWALLMEMRKNVKRKDYPNLILLFMASFVLCFVKSE